MALEQLLLPLILLLMSLEYHLFVGLDSDMGGVELFYQLAMRCVVFQGACTAQVDAFSQAVVGH